MGNIREQFFHLYRWFELFRGTKTHFLTYHQRPHNTTDINVFSDAIRHQPKTAIVLQGPIVHHRDFTLQTIQLYHRLFPDCEIILATWQTEDQDYLKLFDLPKTHIILSQPPKLAGVANINYQLISSQAGTQLAQDIGCQYVLKTRTDQRMYAPNVMEFLLQTVRHFAIHPKYKPHQRIVSMSLNSFKYRLYSLSDMFIFGRTDDVLLYFSAPLDTRRRPKAVTSLRDVSKQNFCEVYLATHYLKAIGFKVTWSLRNSWQALADCFAIIDSESLDLFWPKYQQWLEYRYRTYDQLLNKQTLDYKEWFIIYTALSNKAVIPERTLDYSFDHPVVPQK